MYKQRLGESRIVNRIKKAKTSIPDTYPKEIRGYQQSLIEPGETVIFCAIYGVPFVDKPMITWNTECDATICDISVHLKSVSLTDAYFVIRNKMDTSIELRVNYCIYGEVKNPSAEVITESTPAASAL